MKNQQINIKRRILELFDKSEDSITDYTVLELIKKYRKDIKTYDEAEDEKEQAFMKEFKDVYAIQYTNEGGLFGDELAVYHIKTITRKGYCTDYKRQYSIKGERISFCNTLGTNKREMEGDGNVSNHMSEDELKKLTLITKDKFNEYLKKHDDINRLIADIVESGKRIKIKRCEHCDYELHLSGQCVNQFCRF